MILAVDPWTVVFFVALIVVILAAIALWRDTGKPVVTAGCTLTKFTFKKDRCSTTGCKFACIALTGPYPSWATWSPMTQDVGCIRPARPFSTFPAWVKKAVDAALTAREIADLMRAVEQTIAAQGIDADPKLDALYKMLEKLKNGEKLTDDEREALEKLIGGS